MKLSLEAFAQRMGWGKHILDVTSDESILDFFNNQLYKDNINHPYQPFKFIEEFEQRGDGYGYETFYVFQNKETQELIYYYIYDGRIEYDEMQPCTVEVKRVYSFEEVY